MLESFWGVIPPMFQLLTLMAIGWVFGKKGWLGPEFNKGLATLLMKLALPALIITSMQRDFSADVAAQSLMVLGLSFLLYGLFFLLALLLPWFWKLPQEEKGVFQFVLMFSNVGFMGFPVLEALWGRDILFWAAIFNIPFNFFVFTLGIYLMTKHLKKEGSRNWWVFLNPGVISTLLGFFMFLFSWKLPPLAGNLLTSLGGLTTPLSMILIGSLLARSSVRGAFGNLNLWILSLFRLVIIPFLVYALLSWWGLPAELLGAAVMIAAMPAAANTPLVAHEYGGHSQLAGQTVLVSTLLSGLTIPLVAGFLNWAHL